MTEIKLSDIARTEMSDQAAADSKVKTKEETYKTWIRDAFKARQKEIRVGDEAYGNIAVTIANKCKQDFNNYWAPQRSVYVAILRRPG